MATRTLKKGAEEIDGLIVVTRTHETTEYTQGEFQALGKEGFEGYTMERPGPPTYEEGNRDKNQELIDRIFKSMQETNLNMRP